MIVTVGVEATDVYGNVIEDPDVTSRCRLRLEMINEEEQKIRFMRRGSSRSWPSWRTPTTGSWTAAISSWMEWSRDPPLGPSAVRPSRGTVPRSRRSLPRPHGEIVLFEINDEPVSVDADGNFSFEVTPEWGVNVLRAVARDEFGNITKYSPAYTYSSDM